MGSDSDDSSYRDIKDIETYAEWPESDGSSLKVCTIAAGLGVGEYACVCVFYRMGLEKLVYPAMALQALFFTIAATVDYKIYKKIGSPFRNKTVKTIMLIPVSCLNIPLWFFHLVALSPNYIHVTSTAITAGGIWNVWEEARFQGAKRLFQKHWAYVPLVGGVVGNAGLPWVMRALLLFSCFVHLLIIIGALVGGLLGGDCLVGEVCDAANLQFLTKAMKRAGWRTTIAPPSEQEHIQCARLFACALIKYPMLWAKTSMLAVTYEFMDDAMFQSTMISLALAWYSILQLMPSFFAMVRVMIAAKPPCSVLCPPMCLFGFLSLGLVQQALHLFGVFYCSGSHDFSVMLGGCSPA